MGTFSDNMTATALRLLTAYGEAVSVTRDNITSFNPATGSITDASDTNYTGVGHPQDYAINEIDGTLIQQNDVRLIFYSTTVPVVNDIFTVNSKVYTALNVEQLRAQGANICYIVQLRQ